MGKEMQDWRRCMKMVQSVILPSHLCRLERFRKAIFWGNMILIFIFVSPISLVQGYLGTTLLVGSSSSYKILNMIDQFISFFPWICPTVAEQFLDNKQTSTKGLCVPSSGLCSPCSIQTK